MSWPIERYLNVRQAYGPSFAPDGQRIAFLSDITGVPQVWEAPLDWERRQPLWPDAVTFEQDRISGVAYCPTAERLLYVQDVGGNERHQMFLLERAEAQVVGLTQGHEDAMHLWGNWSPDGKRICFAANRRHPTFFDLYIQDVSGDTLGEVGLVFENDRTGYLTQMSFSPDGERVIAVRTTSSFDHALLEIDLASGGAREILASPEPVRFSWVAYDPSGTALYLVTDLDSDVLRLCRLDLRDGSLETLVDEKWDCSAMVLSPDGSQLVYAINRDGVDELFLLDLEQGETRAVPDVLPKPGVLVGGAPVFARNGRALAWAYSSSVRTTDIYVWDLDRNVVWAATRSSHGGLPTTSFVVPELVHYPTFDEVRPGERRMIPGWFYRPVDTEGPVPAVVMVHGGPEGQFRPQFHFLVQYLLHHGFAVMAPNVRGSTGYGKAYSHLDDVERRMDSVADLAYAALWLQSQPGIDGEHIAVYGGSYGGFMVLAALTTYPELWAAGVDIVGISNLATFLEHTSDYRRAHREAEYGSLARDRSFLESIAPIHHVDQIEAPLMVIHGRNDPRVPLSEAEQLVTALRRRGVPVEFLVFDDEGHGIVKLKNKLVAYPAVVAFLKEHLR